MSKATTATTAALGVVTPWSAPVRLLAARTLLARRRKNAGPAPAPRPRSARKGRSRLRTLVTIAAIGGVVAVGSAVVLRNRSHTPPPVAPTPPRVQDVPTADAAGAATTPE